MPRSATFRYRGPNLDPVAIGRELGVRAVLAGRMVQRGDDLTVSVELVDVERHAQLWGGRFNRKMTDLVALQEELTMEMSEKLRLQLTGEEKKRLRKRPTQNNEAFRLVLQAQHYMSQASPEGLRKGIALCRQAIEIDPAYAAAYARLSIGYCFLGFFGFAAPSEAYTTAKGAAVKALQLDDSLAEAHVGLGYSLVQNNWDFAGAEREARRSLELDPDSAAGFELLARIHLGQGRSTDAVAAARRAVELAPLDYRSSQILGVAYIAARQFDKAIEQSRKSVEMDPRNPLAHTALASAYVMAGDRNRAIEECRRALELGGDRPFVRLIVTGAHALLGDVAEARETLEEFEKNWKPDAVSSFWIAAVHACLGEKSAAFEWLEKAYQERASFLVTLKSNPYFDGLRDDPRFDDFSKRIGVPD